MAGKRLRILLINNQGIGNHGGGPTIIRNLVAGLCEHQDITILSYDPPAEISHDIEQITLPQPVVSYWRLAPLQRAWHYRKVLRALSLDGFDVLLAMDCHLAFAIASIRARLRAYISLSCAPRQEWFGSEQPQIANFAQYAFLERRLIQGSDLTVVASSSQCREIRRFELLPHFQPMILPPVFGASVGADNATGDGMKTRDSGVVTFLTVCRLVPVKRVDRILAIADRLRNRNCRFIIVGGGPQLDQLRRQAEALRVDRLVTFAGETDNPEAYFRQADVLLHPSSYESFGMVVFEAMRHGVIPVCAHGGGANIGIAATMRHDENGILVDFEAIDSTVQAIDRLLEDRDLRHRLGKGARQLAQNLMERNYVHDLAGALKLRAA